MYVTSTSKRYLQDYQLPPRSSQTLYPHTFWITNTVISSHSFITASFTSFMIHRHGWKGCGLILRRLQIFPIELRPGENAIQFIDRMKCCFLNFLITLAAWTGILSSMKTRSVRSNCIPWKRKTSTWEYDLLSLGSNWTSILLLSYHQQLPFSGSMNSTPNNDRNSSKSNTEGSHHGVHHSLCK